MRYKLNETYNLETKDTKIKHSNELPDDEGKYRSEHKDEVKGHDRKDRVERDDKKKYIAENEIDSQRVIQVPLS